MIKKLFFKQQKRDIITEISEKLTNHLRSVRQPKAGMKSEAFIKNYKNKGETTRIHPARPSSGGQVVPATAPSHHADGCLLSDTDEGRDGGAWPL